MDYLNSHGVLELEGSSGVNEPPCVTVYRQNSALNCILINRTMNDLSIIALFLLSLKSRLEPKVFALKLVLSPSPKEDFSPITEMEGGTWQEDVSFCTASVHFLP